MTDPRHRFRGTVQGIGWAVNPEDQPIVPGVPKIERELNWVHIAQRFPVRIRIENPQPAKLFRVGASAVSIIRGWPRSRRDADEPPAERGRFRRMALRRIDRAAAARHRARATLLAFLRRELAPFPGRAIGTLRIVIACVVVLVLCMTLQVPEAYLAVWVVLRSRWRSRARRC